MKKAPDELLVPMKLHLVESSNLHKIGYDPGARLLRVVFLSGSEFDYENVPPEVYAEFMAAKSHGSYFAKRIRPFYQGRSASAAAPEYAGQVAHGVEAQPQAEPHGTLDAAVTAWNSPPRDGAR